MSKIVHFFVYFGLSILLFTTVLLLCYGYHVFVQWLTTVWPAWATLLFIIFSASLFIAVIIWIDQEWWQKKMRVFAGLTLLETPFALLALLLFWFLLKFLNIWVAAIICFVLLSVIMIVVSYKAMTW